MSHLPNLSTLRIEKPDKTDTSKESIGVYTVLAPFVKTYAFQVFSNVNDYSLTHCLASMHTLTFGNDEDIEFLDAESLQSELEATDTFQQVLPYVPSQNFMQKDEYQILRAAADHFGVAIHVFFTDAEPMKWFDTPVKYESQMSLYPSSDTVEPLTWSSSWWNVDKRKMDLAWQYAEGIGLDWYVVYRHNVAKNQNEWGWYLPKPAVLNEDELVTYRANTASYTTKFNRYIHNNRKKKKKKTSPNFYRRPRIYRAR